MASKYTVTYELDEDSWWVASVKGVPGCHTQGRSIAQARTRIREALGLFVKNAAKAELIDDVDLGNLRDFVWTTMKAKLVQARAASERAAKEQARAAEITREIARKLVEKVSVRDAGEILGISHARVQQLVEK